MMNQQHVIVKLPESTIKLIAAGEVITRPFNVVKELVENSIDAGAINIRITIEQGGLKSLEIVDNGHGIAKENAELLCRRYTTSKLNSANDLTRLSTFGFRGEALASISEVANLQVKSFNMRSDKIGWHGTYRHGELIAGPTDHYQQLPGTHICVTALFSASQPRFRNLISSASEEKKIITELITKLALHHRERITFILNERSAGDLVCSIAPVDLGPCIGGFYGSDMESNLFELQIKQSETFEVDLHIAFTYKKATSSLIQSSMILFVNDRLVECDELKRECGAMILEYFAGKQYTTLIYISLKVPPQDIDVNTHPAKSSVTLHFQQEIIVLVLTELRSKFNDNLSSQVVASSKLVQQKTIGELVRYPSSQKSINEKRLRQLAPGCFSDNNQHESPKRAHEQIHNDASQPNLSQIKIAPSRTRRDITLCSIINLRMAVSKAKCTDLKNVRIIKNSVFVGIFDHDRALIQNDTKLYAINLKSYLKEQFYQFYLFDFGNFPPIEILPPGNKIHFMVETHLSHIKQYEPKVFEGYKYSTTDTVIEKLSRHSDMLKDYLNLQFTHQEILTIPNIVPGHVPNLVFLGKFLIDIANQVNFSDEQSCFKDLGLCLADFYSRPPHNLKDSRIHMKYHQLVETSLYEAIKKYLIPPDFLFRPENICQITDTKDLYKVFERC